MLEIQLAKPELREFEFAWNILSNTKKKNKYYNVNPGMEYYQSEKYIPHSPTLNIDSRRWILREETQSLLFRATEIISSSQSICEVISYKTVHKILKSELEYEISSRENTSLKREIQQVLASIQEEISSEISEFDFFFQLEGLELKGIPKIDFGKAEIFIFDEDLASGLTKFHLKPLDQQEDLQALESTLAFFADNFTGRVCIKSTAYGELEIAHTKAYKQAKQVTNYFRYVLCLLFHERITEQIVRINLIHEEYSASEKYCAFRKKDSAVILTWGRGLKATQKFPINEDRLVELFKDCFLKEFSSILNSPAPTELEGLILRALYWVGEAQNEHDLDVAYLKYWTALECIFSEEDNVTKSLIQGITIVNIFSSYKFIEISDRQHISKRINILYDKRSKIIHQGMNHLTQPVVTRLDVSEICKYASWSVLSLFDLRSLNYTTMSQIKEQTERLSAILKKDKHLERLSASDAKAILGRLPERISLALLDRATASNCPIEQILEMMIVSFLDAEAMGFGDYKPEAVP
jgi:Apea-like HEPN